MLQASLAILYFLYLPASFFLDPSPVPVPNPCPRFHPLPESLPSSLITGTGRGSEISHLKGHVQPLPQEAVQGAREAGQWASQGPQRVGGVGWLRPPQNQFLLLSWDFVICMKPLPDG